MDLKNSKSPHSKRNSINISVPTISDDSPTAQKLEENELDDNLLESEDQDYSKSSNKIKDLVKKMLDMRKDERDKDECMEEKFKDLRLRINNSVSFLENTKNQIENIKFLYQQDKLNVMNKQNFDNCLNISNQSIEELNMQISEIQKKLSAAKERAKQSKEERVNISQNFESTVAETVGILKDIGKGVYDKE